jgi:tRNA threonylcarbamoyladenosine biosynthesis protein TsaB
MLDEIGKMIELDLTTIDAVAVAAGPGSFTGLRIGSATAKGLGLALNKPLIEIPTLEGLAYNMYGTADLVCPMMDARRNQVYTGLYAFENGELQIIEGQQAISISQLLEKVNALGRKVVFLGDGVPVYEEQIKEQIRVTYSFAPAHMNKQRAGAVATLALSYLAAGKTVTAEAHQPDYLRLSQAERERAEQEQKK